MTRIGKRIGEIRNPRATRQGAGIQMRKTVDATRRIIGAKMARPI
jgi:hypothetical protein